MTITLLLLILGAICLLCATVGWTAGRINLLALGLLFWIVAVIVGGFAADLKVR